MQDLISPIIHKAPVIGLLLAINRTGLSIGDPASLHLMEDGSVGLFAMVRRRVLFIPRQRLLQLGHLGPQASAIVTPALSRGAYLRVRIVGLTPEHLATDGRAEVFVSIWGHLRPPLNVTPPAAAFGAPQSLPSGPSRPNSRASAFPLAARGSGTAP